VVGKRRRQWEQADATQLSATRREREGEEEGRRKKATQVQLGGWTREREGGLLEGGPGEGSGRGMERRGVGQKEEVGRRRVRGRCEWTGGGGGR